MKTLKLEKVLPLERPADPAKIISVAQFRPEKAHGLQLEAFAVAVGKLDAHLPRPKLQFVGSCRNKSDEERLEHLKNKAIELKVDGDVEFHKNVMYRDLVQLLGGAVAGIHSMTDEHFGISVVEYMAAGAIPIAHNSAGPQMDIVLAEDGEQTGFLARTVDEYADAILSVIKMPETERFKMAAAARRRAARFSEQRFYEDFNAAISPILPSSCYNANTFSTVNVWLSQLYLLRVSIMYGEGPYHIAYCTTEADGEWTKLDKYTWKGLYMNSCCYLDQLYALREYMTVEVWDFSTSLPIKRMEIRADHAPVVHLAVETVSIATP
ncbi:hypothetical protein ACLB2K_076067 [Fragaria x ananassa]